MHYKALLGGEYRFAPSMSVDIRKLFPYLSAVGTAYRTFPQRMMGLRYGKGLTAKGGIHWPKLGLRRISIGERVYIGTRSGFWLVPLFDKAEIIIGDGAWIGDESRIVAASRVYIGANAYILHRVTIADFGRVFNQYSAYGRACPIPKPVIIGRDCSIGSGSVIKPGTDLGDFCVVAPNSVVYGVHPAGSVLEGNPAKVVKMMAVP